MISLVKMPVPVNPVKKHVLRLLRALWRGYPVAFTVLHNDSAEVWRLDGCARYGISLTRVYVHKGTADPIESDREVWSAVDIVKYARFYAARGSGIFPGEFDEIPQTALRDVWYKKAA